MLYLIMGIILLFLVFLILSQKVSFRTKSDDNINPSTTDPIKHTERVNVVKNITLDSFNHNPTGDPILMIVDIETTGLPRNRKARPEVLNNWPRIVSIAWMLFDKNSDYINHKSFIIKPDFKIPECSTLIHQITNEKAESEGKAIQDIMSLFISDLVKVISVASHNIEFDIPIIESELFRLGNHVRIADKVLYCTMENGAKYFNLMHNYTMIRTRISLNDLFSFLYPHHKRGTEHDCFEDCMVCAACFFRMGKHVPPESFIFPSSYYGEYIQPKVYRVSKENPFNSKKIVVTGVFENYSRNELKSILLSCGASVVSTLSKNTNYLIVGVDSGQAKIEKLSELQQQGAGLIMLTEKQFQKMIIPFMENNS